MHIKIIIKFSSETVTSRVFFYLFDQECSKFSIYIIETLGHRNVPSAVYPLGGDRSTRWRKLVASISISTYHWREMSSYYFVKTIRHIVLVISGQVFLPALNRRGRS